MTKQKKMGRLLDEGDVINALWDLRRSLQMMDNTQRADLILQGVYLSEKKIEQLPSAQPKIIRCKECEHWDKSWTNDWEPNCYYCPMIDRVCGENWYCADAERRTDEQITE